MLTVLLVVLLVVRLQFEPYAHASEGVPMKLNVAADATKEARSNFFESLILLKLARLAWLYNVYKNYILYL